MWRSMFGSAWAMQQFICSRNIHFLLEFLVLSISGCVCLVVAVLLYGHLDQTFRAWIILWLVWAPLTSSGQRRHFASRAREYVVKYYIRNWGYCNNQRLKDGVVTSETKSISNDLFFWKTFLIIEYEYSLYNFFSYSWQGSSFENQRSLAPWASPPPTKNESTVLMGGLFLLEHNLDERTLERKSQ